MTPIVAKAQDISVEYAHIYTNNQIGQEQKLSVKILTQIMKKTDKSKISLVVMVDDYSFPDPSFDYNSFLRWLAKEGFKPDEVFRESQLIPICDEIIKLITNLKIQTNLLNYVRDKKYPCSLFIASWYLLRLGCISHKMFDKKLVAKKLINILPLSFKPFEDKALEIINSTPFSNKVKDIEYKYFEGRPI